MLSALSKEKIYMAREVFDKHHHQISSLFFGRFPCGSCGNVSEILAAWLLALQQEDIEYVYGERNGLSHAWLECAGEIIDITGDQFEDFSYPVYIGGKTDFHDSFTNQRRSSPELGSTLIEAYNKFMAFASKSPP